MHAIINHTIHKMCKKMAGAHPQIMHKMSSGIVILLSTPTIYNIG
jgi:hypothetical protein